MEAAFVLMEGGLVLMVAGFVLMEAGFVLMEAGFVLMEAGFKALPPAAPGADPAVPGRLDGALDVGAGHGPGQLLHPLPDGPGRPAGHGLPGTLLPRALAHRGPRHGRG